MANPTRQADRAKPRGFQADTAYLQPTLGGQLIEQSTPLDVVMPFRFVDGFDLTLDIPYVAAITPAQQVGLQCQLSINEVFEQTGVLTIGTDEFGTDSVFRCVFAGYTHNPLVDEGITVIVPENNLLPRFKNRRINSTAFTFNVLVV